MKNSTKNIYDLYANYFNPKKLWHINQTILPLTPVGAGSTTLLVQKTNVLIIGMGNIGTKLSLKLYESGKNIYVTRKNHKKGAENVKLIKNFQIKIMVL